MYECELKVERKNMSTFACMTLLGHFNLFLSIQNLSLPLTTTGRRQRIESTIQLHSILEWPFAGPWSVLSRRSETEIVDTMVRPM